MPQSNLKTERFMSTLVYLAKYVVKIRKIKYQLALIQVIINLRFCWVGHNWARKHILKLSSLKSLFLVLEDSIKNFALESLMLRRAIFFQCSVLWDNHTCLEGSLFFFPFVFWTFIYLCTQLCGMWDPSFTARDQTRASCSGTMES